MTENKIILVVMIKNEEKIITRCIDSVLNLCDAVCITDTGSTDNTCQILENYFKTLSIPCKLYKTNWKNFGHSRSESYNNAVDFCNELKWSNNNTYGLLIDADMKLIVKTYPFDKSQLVRNGYTLQQENSYIKYNNVRFVKLNATWKCVGVTHEYWSGEDVGHIDSSQIVINDVGDGGCKADKFSRDIRLLEQGIIDEPNNVRYYFYLAQSYRDSNDFNKAIQYYKKRIDFGGWIEEIYQSYYSISTCYLRLNNIRKFEQYGQMAYDYKQNRYESIYQLCKYFREKKEYYKALHYCIIGLNMKPNNDVLFIEKLEGKFEYEYSIIHYYVFPNDRLTGLKYNLNYFNNNMLINDNNVKEHIKNNIYYYLERLADKGTLLDLEMPDINFSLNQALQQFEKNGQNKIVCDHNFKCSSPCIIKYKGRTLINYRYVNYILNDSLLYQYNDNLIITINGFTYVDLIMNRNGERTFNKTSDLVLFENIKFDNPKSNIYGLEDVRLIEFKGKIIYFATSREFTDVNRIVMGEYDIQNVKYLNNMVLYPPVNTYCEKNWIPFNYKDEEILIIYKWYPLQYGRINGNKLEIINEFLTPKYFEYFRGSSTLVKYNDLYYAVVHGVKYEENNKRKYFHNIVVLSDKNAFNLPIPIQYSAPFYFNKFCIEYCIGLIIEDDIFSFIFSQRDRNPNILNINMKEINKLLITI
jgi:hypothetical protein